MERASEVARGAAPIDRVAARVLPVNPVGEVLLLEAQDPAHPGVLHWVSIGGAVEPGETLAAAAVREMREETGLRIAESDLVGPMHRASHPFSWAGVDYRSDNHFFALVCAPDVVVDFAGLDSGETGNILRADWWTPSALAEAGNAASVDLPEIMAAAVAALREGIS
jgi:8-oxo-dGTP pyrophosphatase MutT (NUDIX family)